MAPLSSDRWQQLERIYLSALGRDKTDRVAYLREACGGDEALRSEIESLLAQDESEPPTGGPDVARAVSADQVSGEYMRADGRSDDTLPIWVRVVIAIAVSRTVIALTLYFSAPLPVVPLAARNPAVLPPWWMYAALSCTFIALGLGLTLANRRDARAAWLGGILTLAGVPFATPLLQASSPGTWLINVRPEAFSPALLWCFLSRFPTELVSAPGRAIVRVLAGISACVGLWCAVASIAILWPDSGGGPWLTSFAVTRGSLYWPAVLGLTAPTFPLLLWRSAVAKGVARHRIRVFVSGLLAGFAPFTLEVLIEETVPAYKAWAYGPTVAPWIGSAIFGALAIVPFVTTYSVLFDRVVDVRVVLRAAAQYVLARYTILGVTLVPFAALAIFISQHRTEPIVSLVTGARPLLLGSVIALGLMSLRLRTRWLYVLDRRYFRESYEAHEILGRIVELQGTSSEQLAGGIRQELERAFHAEADVFLADEPRMALRHTGGRLPSIALSSKLADLVLADPRPMEVDLDRPHTLLSRLPEVERYWLRRGNFSLLIGLRRASGGLDGMLALAPKRSGVPFSDDDRRLLSAIGSVASLAFDSMRLRTTPATPIERPARECLECGRLSSFDTEQCECGGDLAIAKVPHVLRGTFRFKQRIGAGGMGVVYRAVDLSLGRDVAIKALPRVTPELVTRLRREARAMAAVTHPNLAVIHGVETWQGMPFLVQEYLAGGTLSQRLAVARPTILETIDLGLTLGSLLQQMHTAGVIHCDIKPSNIGFTRQGVVKLLDFGLARVMRAALSVTATTTGFPRSTSATETESDGSGAWFGTPYFMSPEAARGEPAAPSFDLWALAVVLYEAIAGRRPFEGHDAWEILERIQNESAPDIREASPDIPVSVSAFFDSTLARDVSQRPPDAFAFVGALRRLRDRLS